MDLAQAGGLPPRWKALDGEMETPKNSAPPEDTAREASTGGADDKLAHAHEQIVKADEQLTRLSEQLAKLERDNARPSPAEPAPQQASPLPAASSSPAEPSPPAPSITPPPAAVPSPPAKPALRAPAGVLLLAAAIIVAVLVFQLTYEGGAHPPPQLASASSSPAESPPQPAAPSVQIAAAEAVPATTPPRPMVLAQAAPKDAAPGASATAPDQTQLLQTIARDLTKLEKDLEQLKATQQQIANDNSKAIGELRASQEEMKRALAKVSEQNPPRTSQAAAPPAPVVRRPARPPQARPRVRYPQEWMYDDW